MSTWHDKEPLAEAIWFALNNAWPDPGYEEGCTAVVGISIGNEGWAAELGKAFADPSEFNKQLLASE
jgi:hypothetical protein